MKIDSLLSALKVSEEMNFCEVKAVKDFFFVGLGDSYDLEKGKRAY